VFRVTIAPIELPFEWRKPMLGAGVVIVGAGVAGSALATTLARHGVAVLLESIQNRGG